VARLRLEPRSLVTAQALVPVHGALSRAALVLLAAVRRHGAQMPGVTSLVARGRALPEEGGVAGPAPAAPG
jgi:hypothetical protein